MLPFGATAVSRARWAGVSPTAWSGLAVMTAIAVVSYLVYVFALTKLTASRVAAFAYLSPLITAALGRWWLAEKLTPRVILCGAIILAGVYLTEGTRDNGQSPGEVATTPR